MNDDKINQYGNLYRGTLLNDVIPFNMKHAPDREKGGYFHCFDCDGTVINTDKYVWSQNRQAWVYSMFYNNLQKRDDWMEMAKLGIDFLKKHGRNSDGDWYFCLDREGNPLIQPYNIFSDCFAVMAFSEYAKATKEQESLDIALNTYDRIQQRKSNSKGKYSKVISKNRNMKNLSVSMINLNISTIMKSIAPDPKYDDIIRGTITEIMTQFLDSENRVVHENVTPDGKYVDSTFEGRHINPGHGIETMWFIMTAAKERGDMETANKACKVVKWLLDFGWDREFGGIYYFMDKYGKPHPELCWDMKLEWVHVEALVATMMGYQLTGDKTLLNWFEKIHDYTWTHFPDKEYGEWYKYLNRQGQVNNRCKGNHWQNFFHLPRALFMISEMCAG